MTKEEIKKLVDDHVSQIREHVDSVKVFVTFPTDDGTGETAGYESGSGNFYAQFGQINEWLNIQRQYQKNWAIRRDTEKHGPSSP